MEIYCAKKDGVEIFAIQNLAGIIAINKEFVEMEAVIALLDGQEPLVKFPAV